MKELIGKFWGNGKKYKVIIALIALAIFMKVTFTAGESVGRALYHMTH